ncbi:hypothetical protein BKA63DRAFT_424979 [Paraphoma chrysanthemicola]|nr:hypothetical protein BKA63DRAFT_424979 [Paraphoma chrysanthemicola]
MAYRRGRKPTSGVKDVNQLFDHVKVFQDLLRFQHDPRDMDPAISVVQEYARAVRLLYIKTRWSKLGLADWHAEMRILLCARESTLMGLDIWEPLDDFFDTYIFEMEVQPMAELDAQGRKLVKRGLLRQLQDAASRELEACHRELCDLLADRLSNWRSLDSKMLIFKKKVWLDCEARGSLCLEPVNDYGTVNVVTNLADGIARNSQVENISSSPAFPNQMPLAQYTLFLQQKQQENNVVQVQRVDSSGMLHRRLCI